jgi:hypothetical protein
MKNTDSTKDALVALNKAADLIYNIEGNQWQEAYEALESIINKLNNNNSKHKTK